MASEPLTSPSASLASQVSRAVVWNALFVPVRMVAELVTTVVKLTVLSPASYGLLALVSGATSGLGTGIDLGTTRALPKYIPETSRAGGPRATLRLLMVVFAMQLVVLVVAGGGLVVFREQYLDGLRGKILEDRQLTVGAQGLLLGFVHGYGWLLIGSILALLLLGIVFDMLMAYLNSFFKQRAWNGITLVSGLLLSLLSAGAILSGWDVVGVLLAMVAAPALAVVLAVWQVVRLRRDIAGLPQPVDDGRVLPAGFVRYCGVSFLMTATDFLASQSFAVFLARNIGDVALLWAGTSVVRMVLGYLYTPMIGVQVPLFTRVRAGEGGTLLGAYQSLIRLQVLLLVPGGIGLMLLAHPVLAVLTPRYVAAAPLVWVLTPCLFVESLLTTAHNALIVYERLRIILISRLLTLVVVPLALLLPPLFGVVGAALAFGVARVVAGGWVTASGYRLLGLRWPWRFTLRVVVASVVMAVVVVGMMVVVPQVELATFGARLQQAGLLFGVAIGGVLSFLVVLRVQGGLDEQDRQQLARLRLPLRRWVLRVL